MKKQTKNNRLGAFVFIIIIVYNKNVAKNIYLEAKKNHFEGPFFSRLSGSSNEITYHNDKLL